MKRSVTVVGGGLAGSEAAWQLASAGTTWLSTRCGRCVTTPAHKTDRLAELVCSNTFKSTELTNAHGLLKAEMRLLGSLILEAADEARVAGGSALAVDRDVFRRAVTERIAAHPRISVVREEVVSLPAPAVIATGPLTSDALADAIRARLGVGALAFYDAIAPIVARDSIDDAIVFRASRYGKETMEGADDDGAYLNCPMSREQYDAFIDALIAADQYHGHEFDEVPYFEGCMPVEEMAQARAGDAALRSDEAGRPARSAHRARAARRRAAAAGGSRRPHVEPGRLPDAPPDSGAAARVPDDPGTRARGVSALRLDPPQLVPQLAGGAERRISPLRDDPTTAVRRPAHRRRGLHRELGDRSARGDQPLAHARRARSR